MILNILITWLSLILIFFWTTTVESKVHLYKQVVINRKTSQAEMPLCSDGKKLSHPDPGNPQKYFMCQYISKADMWLIHPMNCSKNQIFNSKEQICESSFEQEYEHPHRLSLFQSQGQGFKFQSPLPAPVHVPVPNCENHTESLAKLTTAVASLSETLRILTNKFILMVNLDQPAIRTTTTTPISVPVPIIEILPSPAALLQANGENANQNQTESEKRKGSNSYLIKRNDTDGFTHYNYNYSKNEVADLAGDEKNVSGNGKVNVLRLPSPFSLSESEDPGNTASEEDYSAEEFVHKEQKHNSNSITSSPGFPATIPTPSGNTNTNNNPFFKIFFQNLLTPTSPPNQNQIINNRPFFIKTPSPLLRPYFHYNHQRPARPSPSPLISHPQMQNEATTIRYFDLFQEMKPIPLDPGPGKFVNLFSMLNYLTGTGNPNSEKDHDKDNYDESESSTESIQEVTVTSSSTSAAAKFPYFEGNFESAEDDLKRKPVNSTTIISSSNLGSENLNFGSQSNSVPVAAAAFVSHNRKPRFN